MTVTVNGHEPAVTVRDDVQMCVRAPENPGPVSDPAGSAQGTMCTPVTHPRAIPPAAQKIKANVNATARNFVSLHGGEALNAARTNRTANQTPMTVADAWRHVTPGPGEVSSRTGWVAATVAGLFRAAVLTVLYGCAVAVGTRIGAGVALALVLLTAAIGAVVSALTP